MVSTQNQRQELLIRFEHSTDRAVEALFTWKAYLQVWRNHPTLDIPDDFFMSIIQDMSAAGLMEFLDGTDLDELRETLTGVEA